MAGFKIDLIPKDARQIIAAVKAALEAGAKAMLEVLERPAGDFASNEQEGETVA